MAAIITHQAVEVLKTGNPNASITHQAVEVLKLGNPNALITHQAVEVLCDTRGEIQQQPIVSVIV